MTAPSHRSIASKKHSTNKLTINRVVDKCDGVPRRSTDADSPGAGANPDVLDAVFFALSDPVRRAILRRLEDRSLLVSELSAPFDISLQAVSRHIQVLVRAGLVRKDRSGRIARCRLEVGPIFEAAVWINRYSRYWQAQFDALAGWLDRLDDTKAKSGNAKRRSVKFEPGRGGGR